MKVTALERLVRVVEGIEAAHRERDRLIARLHADGVATPAELAAAAKLSRGRIHQIVKEIAQEAPPSEAASATINRDELSMVAPGDLDVEKTLRLFRRSP
jgi:hypothetical protein